eukprot:1140849-Pelagomonas_calceolata.AAC.1
MQKGNCDQRNAGTGTCAGHGGKNFALERAQAIPTQCQQCHSLAQAPTTSFRVTLCREWVTRSDCTTKLRAHAQSMVPHELFLTVPCGQQATCLSPHTQPYSGVPTLDPTVGCTNTEKYTH